MDRELAPALAAKGGEPLLGDERLERFEFLCAESAKVVVEHVDARDRAAGEVGEHRITGEPLEVEDAPRARDGRVDQELHLRVHGVHDAAADLQVPELLWQSPPRPSAWTNSLNATGPPTPDNVLSDLPRRTARALARRTRRLAACHSQPSALLLPTLGRGTFQVLGVFLFMVARNTHERRASISSLSNSHAGTAPSAGP
jgi:hypothetical protein